MTQDLLGNRRQNFSVQSSSPKGELVRIVAWFTLINKNNLGLFSFLLQGSMGSITCIAWKGDTLVLGDVDGNLNFWDLKARLSR